LRPTRTSRRVEYVLNRDAGLVGVDELHRGHDLELVFFDIDQLFLEPEFQRREWLARVVHFPYEQKTLILIEVLGVRVRASSKKEHLPCGTTDRNTTTSTIQKLHTN